MKISILIIIIIIMTGLYIHQYIRKYKYKVRARLARTERTEMIDFINRYAASIGYSENTDEWMEQVARFIAQAIEAQNVFIFFMDSDDNTARKIARYGVFPAYDGDINKRTHKFIDDIERELINLNSEGLINQVISNISVLKDDFKEHYGAGPIETLMSVPLKIDGDQLGVICAINRSGTTRLFDSESVFLLESLSSQVALGLTFTQIYERLNQQQRIEQELELAKNIQMSLLPSDSPIHHNYQIFADCIAAREVSGDFFDFIQISEDLLLVIVADASGKGIPACMLMSMCRSIIHTNAWRFKEDLEGLLREINSHLYEDTDAAQFITLACLLIDKHDHVVDYARAGHTELLIQSPTGDIQIISPDGPALGLLPNELSNYDTFSFKWQPGASIMMFSDGLTEALDEDDDELGLEGLLELWKAMDRSPEKATHGILAEVKNFAGDRQQEDDQTLIILHRPELV
ncbi:MAG: SpoIIE family protein phosphatase [Lentisphaeria bacterium]|nr:SpoIIE family protein phosphatase [Lentisphaeria bacterium]NQZ69410.1 SpoIIE family protein phosphatase [Lentisphaeria bacterium]